MAISGCDVPTYQQASWKGVPFNVESSADEFGRRGDLYEYPLSERTAYKDLGRKARRFRVEGYLIGSQQVSLTQQMKKAAESAEPGTLVHPIYGSQKVACVTLTATADYKKDKRRTKLTFEFIEANDSMSPYKVGDQTPSNVDKAGSNAVEASKDEGAKDWGTDTSRTNAQVLSGNLSEQVKPATDESSFNVVDELAPRDPAATFDERFPKAAPGTLNVPSLRSFAVTAQVVKGLTTFRDVTDPIDDGTATIRRIHDDALVRLREFNRFVVGMSSGDPGVEALVVTARLCLIRDFAVKAAMTQYRTVRDALVDLDFIMSVYDDEENAATAKCADALVTAIRSARATAAQTILQQNIRLPGVVQSNVNGVWPSLVAAHKLYFDGRRYQDVENYNPSMSPFFVGRDILNMTPPGAFNG